MKAIESVQANASEPYAILRDGDFALFLVGRLISNLGLQMLTVTVGWELYERTHSALALGLVGLTEAVTIFLFTLPAGHLADNYARERIIKPRHWWALPAVWGLRWFLGCRRR